VESQLANKTSEIQFSDQPLQQPSSLMVLVEEQKVESHPMPPNTTDTMKLTGDMNTEKLEQLL